MAADRRPAVFLDRDGTVVEEAEYLNDPGNVRLVPGAAAAVRGLREAGLLVVIVTNQSGIARGLYREEDYHAVQARVTELLAAEGAAVDGVYYCPHHPDFTGPCHCRKPGPGMYLAAERELGAAPERSWFVGDKPSDVEPARLFGGAGVLVRTGYGRESEARVGPEVRVVEDLSEAAALVLRSMDRTGRKRPSRPRRHGAVDPRKGPE